MSHDGPPRPPRWGPPEPGSPAGLEGLFEPDPPAPAGPPPPFSQAADPFAAYDPFGTPDPAAVAAEHHAAAEAAGAGRASGAHRARPGPARYVLPAIVGALVLVAVGIGVAGWIGTGSGDTAGGTVPVVLPPASTHASSGGGPSAGSPSASTAPTATGSPSRSARPTPSASTPAPRPTSTAPVRPPVVHRPTVVLNETRQHGLAAQVAAHLRSLGWTVTGVGNWRGAVPTTTVYYPSGWQAAARSLAYDLGVERTRPRVAGMLTDRLTVVLTSDPLG